MKNIFLYLLLSLLAFTSSAQNAMIKKGDDHFKKMAYPTAITYYTKAYKKDSTNQEAVFRLADCYRLTNDRINAEKFYGKAVTMSSATSLQKFYYGQALMNNGKYAQARNLDGEVSAEASKKISLYSASIPPKDEAHMRGMTEGARVSTGCWIGETVSLRYN